MDNTNMEGLNEKQTGLKHGVVMPLVTLICALLGVWGITKEVEKSLSPEFLDRIESLETRLDVLVRENLSCQNLNVALNRQLSEKVTQKTVLSAFMDDVPYPMWTKKYEASTKSFHMAFLNDAYARHFDIPKIAYLGKTDFEVWPFEQAQKYYERDIAVYNSRRYRITDEIVTLRDQEIARRIVKFVVQLPHGELGVGGIQVDRAKETICDSKTVQQ